MFILLFDFVALLAAIFGLMSDLMIYGLDLDPIVPFIKVVRERVWPTLNTGF